MYHSFYPFLVTIFLSICVDVISMLFLNFVLELEKLIFCPILFFGIFFIYGFQEFFCIDFDEKLKFCLD